MRAGCARWAMLCASDAAGWLHARELFAGAGGAMLLTMG